MRGTVRQKWDAKRMNEESRALPKERISHTEPTCMNHVIGRAWISSPILVHSMLSYLYSTYVGPYVTAGVASLAAHSYCAPLLPPHALIVTYYPAPFRLPHQTSMSNSEPMLERCGQKERKKDSRWDLGWQSCHIAPPMKCYLTHTCPTVFTFT